MGWWPAATGSDLQWPSDGRSAVWGPLYTNDRTHAPCPRVVRELVGLPVLVPRSHRQPELGAGQANKQVSAIILRTLRMHSDKCLTCFYSRPR